MRRHRSPRTPSASSGATADALLSLGMLGAGVALLLIGWMGRSYSAGRLDWAQTANTPGLRTETLVGSLALWAGAAVLFWWLMSMMIAFIAAACELRGQRVPSAQLRRWTPSFMRRLALAILSLNLLAAPGAHADVSAAPDTGMAAPSASGIDRNVRGVLRMQDPGHPAGPAHTAGGIRTQIDTTAPGRPSPPADPLDPAWSAAVHGSLLSDPEVPPAGHQTPAASAEESGSLDPGWTPSPSPPEAGHLAASPQRSPAASRTAGREVEVRPGDSLWTLAARELGPRATDLEIARFWPRWHTANRAVIGEDPDHLLPGMVLTVPDRA